MQGLFRAPVPRNEQVLPYWPGFPDRKAIKDQLQKMLGEQIEIRPIINGVQYNTFKVRNCVVPHDFKHVLATYHQAGAKDTYNAIEAAMVARESWANTPWQTRAAIFLKAADLLSGKYRHILNAATMLNQSKTVHQAEIDAACELIDFWRFNVHFLEQIMAMQPNSAPGMWNQTDWRPLDGFVYAVTPFNFTSIAGNLPTAPALMGNTVIWKPASSAVYSAWFIMQILMEAGLPAGVINFLPGNAESISSEVLRSQHLAGIHFTGSTEVFNSMVKTVGENLESYRCYPRLVGETGGKDFIFAHASADIDALTVALVRGAFEYQGQKCSACSRAYIPASLWSRVMARLILMTEAIKMGDVCDFRKFMGAVIDQHAYNRLSHAIQVMHEDENYELVVGGSCDQDTGWFISPTVFRTRDPIAEFMCTELFGPVLVIYVYDDKDYEQTLQLCDHTSPYALTGSVFAQDRQAIDTASRLLRFAAGNFYINDKPTGAVVGQQPFGGSRASGTNDKAGSMLNLLRWTSPRTIKETFEPPTDWRYRWMEEE